jgi:hypothetical protein
LLLLIVMSGFRHPLSLPAIISALRRRNDDCVERLHSA